jgi:hypothetical protein
VSLANPTFYEFAPTLDDLFQQGFVARELQEGLDTEFAFRRQATEIVIPGRLGSQIIIPKYGRKGPVVAPLNPNTLTNNLDNGMTPSLAASETYSINLSEWGDTSDVDLVGSLAMCADLVTAASRDNGVQAAQSIERLAKIQIHAAYDTGNTWVRGDLGGTSTTQVHVDDIRGFLINMVNGVQVAVSAQNPLPCVEVKTGPSGQNQTFSVTGYVQDTPNQSLYPSSSQDVNGNPISDGYSGILTITGATAAPVAGDAIIATNAAQVMRPMNKYSYNVLNSGDVMTLQLLLAGVARLRSNAVPVFPDGTYHFLYDPSVELQLFSDQQFMIAYASREASEEYQDARVYKLMGMTFIPTTEAYVQVATPSLGVKTGVRRSLLIGAGALGQGNWEGLEMYQNQDGLNPMGGCMLVNNVAQIMRPPLDRFGRVLSLSWTWVGSMYTQTDSTATPNIIPTASSAIYKRCVVFQTAA